MKYWHHVFKAVYSTMYLLGAHGNIGQRPLIFVCFLLGFRCVHGLWTRVSFGLRSHLGTRSHLDRDPTWALAGPGQLGPRLTFIANGSIMTLWDITSTFNAPLRSMQRHPPRAAFGQLGSHRCDRVRSGCDRGGILLRSGLAFRFASRQCKVDRPGPGREMRLCYPHRRLSVPKHRFSFVFLSFGSKRLAFMQVF